MHYKTHIYEDNIQASRAVAEVILEKSFTKSNEGKMLNVALSGGSTPQQLFKQLADEYANLIPWKNINLYWVDERCVPPTDSESNFGMTYDTLLNKSFIPAENIHRIKGEDIPKNEVERYKELLWKNLPVKNGFPVFDIILLGMGDDGHTASIFPNNLELLHSEYSVAQAMHPLSGQKRITLTGKTICNAEKILFLICGISKAHVLKQIINNEPDSKQFPAANIGNCECIVDFYIDKKAGSLL